MQADDYKRDSAESVSFFIRVYPNHPSFMPVVRRQARP